MTPHQKAEILRAADLIDEAASIFSHDFWMSLPKSDRDRIEAIPGMDGFEPLLATRLRQMVQRDKEGSR